METTYAAHGSAVFMPSLLGMYACVLKIIPSQDTCIPISADEEAEKLLQFYGKEKSAETVLGIIENGAAYPFKKELKEFLEPATAAARLNGKKFISIEYLRLDGGWSLASLAPCEYDAEGAARSLLLFIQDSYKNIERYNKEVQHSKIQEDIAFALSTKYISIYHVDLDKDLFTIQQITTGLRNDVAEFAQNAPQRFSSAIKTYIQVFASSEEQEYLESVINSSYIVSRFQKEPSFSIRYSVKPNPENQVYFEISFIDASKSADEHIMILAWRCIDDIMKKEIEYQKLLKQTLNDTNKTYQEVLRLQSSGIIAYQHDTKKITIINNAACRILGIKGASNIKDDIARLSSRWTMKNPRKILYLLMNIRADEKPLQFEFTMRHDNGEQVNIMAQAKMIELESKEVLVLISLTDITEQARAEEKFRHLSETDALTGIPNRGFGETKMKKLLSRKKEGMFCIIDVDKFKPINDTYGHSAGDIVLKKIAAALRESFRPEDIVFRLGGDEFAVFSAGTQTEAEALHAIQAFTDAAKKLTFPAFSGISVSLSIGAAFCRSSENETFDSLYIRADNAMYKSKKAGGGMVSFCQ